MAKITLSDLQNLSNKVTAVNAINTNNQRIETAMENTLSRDGTGPNEMEASLDMNDHPIYNLPRATSPTEPVRKSEFDELEIAGDVEALVLAVAEAQAAAAAAVVSAAAADAARIAAEAAASGNIVNFDTLADIEAATIPVLVAYLRTAGHTTAGDRGAALYKRVVSEPTHVAKVQSADGAWWEFAGDVLYSRQVGVHNSAASAGQALEDFLAAAAALAIPSVGSPGDTYDVPSDTISIPSNTDFNGSACTIRRTTDVTDPLFESVGTSGTPKVNVIIRGMNLVYTPLTTTTGITNSTALWLKFVYGYTVTNLSISGQFYIGFRSDDCRNGTLRNGTLSGLYNRAIYVAAVTHTENIHVSDCVCNGYKVGTTTELTNHIVNVNDYNTGTGDNITFTKVWAGNGEKVLVNGEAFAVGGQFSNVIFDKCIGYNCSTGVYIAKPIGGVAFKRVRVSNCEFNTCTRGIYALDGNFLQLMNNHILGSVIESIRLEDVVLATVTGNMADNASGSSNGIVFAGSSLIVTLTGNIVYGHAGGTGISTGSSTQYISASGNISSGNLTNYSILGTNHYFPTGAGTPNL